MLCNYKPFHFHECDTMYAHNQRINSDAMPTNILEVYRHCIYIANEELLARKNIVRFLCL